MATTKRVSKDLINLRLDKATSVLFEEFSRTKLKEWILNGNILLNGEIASPREKVNLDDEIEVNPVNEVSTEWYPEDVNFSVLHETDDFLIVDKPINLVIHPGAGISSGTLANGLLFKFPKLEELPRAGIVHRLDKDTSGLMVIARNEKAYKHLSDQISSRTVKRGYDLIVIGKTLRAGTLDFPIGRHRTVRTKQSVTEKGKEAITKFKVLEFLGFYTYIRAYLETGRTHQIRVHFSHIKHPLVGDKTYGTSQRFAKNTSDDLKDFIIKFPRQALHARELSFIDPSSNETVNFESEIPKDFQSLLDRLKTNENLT